MPKVEANGISIEVDTTGDPADPAVLLIMGLGFQLIHWPDGLVDQLAARGFHVIRFDNRDVGLSTWFDDQPEPNMAAVWLRSKLGIAPKVAYTLSDMAGDAAGVLDALGIEAAHVVGVSMGGMIAQRLAIEHPDRVLSLCSTMSSPGQPVGSFGLTLKLMRMDQNPDSREGRIKVGMDTFRLIAGNGFPLEEDHLLEVATIAADRAWHPAGTNRQMAAIMADGDRGPGLADLDVPTTVIHGTDDRLMLPKCGRRTANAVPGAELVLIEGMGHEWPEGAWPELLDTISGLVERTGS
ncbi:MAG: alpha/beta hydrolase [Acidimicrobiia bacterium]|nr:alpha/beta hydrolase [Actinomycetota bacterium]MBL6923951.1 alpha/beta hydrolase [Acidimicrobiia bacterium]